MSTLPNYMLRRYAAQALCASTGARSCTREQVDAFLARLTKRQIAAIVAKYA